MLVRVVPAAITPVGGSGPVGLGGTTRYGRGRRAGGELMVDIEGGVTSPGIHRLPAGSRVADAFAAAGGYAESADLAAAAQTLNLAAELVDGQQIWVPIIGAGPPVAVMAGMAGAAWST